MGLELRKLNSTEELQEYYRQRDLAEVKDRIDHLMDAMEIKLVRHCCGATQEEILEGLEDTALFGVWRCS